MCVHLYENRTQNNAVLVAVYFIMSISGLNEIKLYCIMKSKTAYYRSA